MFRNTKTKQLIAKTSLVFCVIILCTPLTTIAQQATQSSNTTTTEQSVLSSNTTMNTTAETDSAEGWWSNLPKEKKMIYTTTASAAAIGIWGLATWDYGSSGLHKAEEGWFGEDSKYGGADKLGHFWATYAFSDALTGLYKSWGYDSRKASNYGALSAFLVQFAMEFGDATSETQGFSWEDLVMDGIGALTSILMERYPELDRKIDFRVEYIFNVEVNNIFDDYSNQFYSMVLNLDGFDYIENSFLKYLEFSAGYYSRGYDTDEVDKNRSLYAGISLNFSRFFYQNDWNKTGKVLEYIDLPYTVLKVSHDLD